MRPTRVLRRLAVLLTICMALMGTVPIHALQATDVRVVTNSAEAESNHWMTFTAFLTCGDALPTGKVTFFADNEQVATADIVDGVALLGITFTPGNHDVSAQYSGDTNCGQGSGVIRQLVVLATVVTLTSSVNPSQAGQAVTFTANISCSDATGGSFQFSDGGNVFGTIPLTITNSPYDGFATITTSSLSEGAHQITATLIGAPCSGVGASLTKTQFVGISGITWCNLATDGRLNSGCGDRIVAYCNSKVDPANIDLWVIDTESQGHELTTIPLSLLSSVPAGKFVKGLGNSGVIFAGLDADGNGYAALLGGPYGGTAKGDWAKTFTCKKS